MSVYPSVTKSVFRSVHKSLKVPPAVAGSSGGGGAFDPDLSGIQSRILDGGTIWTDAISSKYYLKDQSTDNTHLPRQGRCWLFDGVNDFGSSALAALSGELTFSLWVKPTTIASVAANGTVIFGDHNGSGVNQSLGVGLNRDAAGLNPARLWVSVNGTIATGQNSTSLTTGWNHIAVVRTGSSGSWTYTFYLNGVADGTATSSTNPGTQGGFTFGRPGAFNGLYFSGSIRDGRLYSTAKSAGEITAIYNQSRTGNGAFDSTNLVACYPCNEESGTTGYDISGNGNHLTLTNITQATFHAADTGVLTNSNNDNGYCLGVNMAKYSEDLTNSVWKFSNIGTTTIGNQATSPDSTVTADEIREDTSTGVHRVWRYEAALLTVGVRYVFSVFIKANGRSKIEFSGDTNFTVDLNAETNTNGTISSVGNGWYRVSSTYVAATAATSMWGMLYNGSTTYTGDGVSGVFMWGGQIEQGSVPTTYQRTQDASIAGRYIPKRLSDSLAADGNALTVTGRAAYHGCAEVPCVTGDGSSVYADLGSALIPATADFELSFWYYHSGTTRSWVINQWASGQAGRISVLANSQTGVANPGYVDFAVEGTTVTSASASLVANTWNYFTITRIGSSLTCTFTPSGGSTVSLTSITHGSSLYVGANTKFLDASSSLPNPSRVSRFQLTTGGNTTYFPLQDGPGSSNTNRNIAYVKSDGTGGVISNAIVNGTVSTIWGNRVPGQVKDWCIDYGGRIGAAGEYIAGLIGSANAADGNAKTLSAGKHGNPFSRVNLNPATAAEFNGRGVPTAGEVGDLINGTITPDDTGFNRVDTDGDDRFLIYEDTLTGADLTNVENYVS